MTVRFNGVQMASVERAHAVRGTRREPRASRGPPSPGQREDNERKRQRTPALFCASTSAPNIHLVGDFILFIFYFLKTGTVRGNISHKNAAQHTSVHLRAGRWGGGGSRGTSPPHPFPQSLGGITHARNSSEILNDKTIFGKGTFIYFWGDYSYIYNFEDQQ